MKKCYQIIEGITYKIGCGKQFNNISLDRINPKEGYTKENTRLVCTHVNMMKSNLSDKELLNYCQKIINYK